MNEDETKRADAEGYARMGRSGLAERLRSNCDCADCVDAEQQYDGSWRGSFSTCLYCQAAATITELADALRAVLERDSWWSPSAMLNDCGCARQSRAAEREYESGKCPHQRALAVLAKLEEKR